MSFLDTIHPGDLVIVRGGIGDHRGDHVRPVDAVQPRHVVVASAPFQTRGGQDVEDDRRRRRSLREATPDAADAVEDTHRRPRAITTLRTTAEDLRRTARLTDVFDQIAAAVQPLLDERDASAATEARATQDTETDDAAP